MAKKKLECGTGRKGMSPLVQAKALLEEGLKSTDWCANLDPKSCKQTMPHLQSGSVIVDYLIGGKLNSSGFAPCPGIPRGRIFNLYGHESSGKTTLALQVAARTIENGGVVCYIDWEHEIVPYYALALGVPIHDSERFMLCQPETLEDGLAILWTTASAGVDLIVLDSVGAGVPRVQFEKGLKEVAETGRVGLNAAVWSVFLPKLKGRVRQTNAAVLGISQMRANINTAGPYGETETIQGGKAWKFYSAVRMRLRRLSTEKATDYSALENKATERVVGAKVRAKLDKCKVSAQQGNEEDFYIRWGEGIDDLRSLIEVGVAHRCVVKTGKSSYAWTDTDGTEHKRVGIEKFRAMFAESPAFSRQLEKQVRPYLASRGGVAGEVEAAEEDFGPEIQDDGELQEILNSMEQNLT